MMPLSNNNMLILNNYYKNGVLVNSSSQPYNPQQVARDNGPQTQSNWGNPQPNYGNSAQQFWSTPSYGQGGLNSMMYSLMSSFMQLMSSVMGNMANGGQMPGNYDQQPHNPNHSGQVGHGQHEHHSGHSDKPGKPGDYDQNPGYPDKPSKPGKPGEPCGCDHHPTTPGGGTTNPGGGTTDPGNGTTDPGDGTTNPGGGTTDPGTDPPQNDVDGNFPPGSLALEDVPKDANGNVSQAFLKSMLTPTNAVNTNILDSNSASGLSKFAQVGIRLMGHDLYDGKLNGDVVLRSLLAPDKSGNTPFTVDDQTIDMVKQWGKMDLEDDGNINGSVYGQLVEDVWPTTDHNSIQGFAKDLNYTNANLNAAELFRQTPNVETPDGMNEALQQMGLKDTELQDLTLWGHRILDKNNTTQDIADKALNDPTSIDFGPTHLNNNTMQHAQDLKDDPDANTTVGLSVLNTLIKLLK